MTLSDVRESVGEGGVVQLIVTPPPETDQVDEYVPPVLLSVLHGRFWVPSPGPEMHFRAPFKSTHCTSTVIIINSKESMIQNNIFLHLIKCIMRNTYLFIVTC